MSSDSLSEIDLLIAQIEEDRGKLIFKASLEGDKEEVERLLSLGAGVNYQDEVCDIDDCCDE